MVRKIVYKFPDELVKQDMERYRKRAIELGARDAKIITTNMIAIDERVRVKCIYPKCDLYGTNANCPPYALDLDVVREIVSNYHYGILINLEVPSRELIGPEAMAMKLFSRSQIKLHEIVSKIEAEAFYDGYYLALGFAGGSCKTAFCPTTDCSALTPGQACRHSLRARSSLEGMGMDAYRMAVEVGWDIYPIGRSSIVAEVPHGTRVGLVLIY